MGSIQNRIEIPIFYKKTILGFSVIIKNVNIVKRQKIKNKHTHTDTHTHTHTHTHIHTHTHTHTHIHTDIF